MNLIDLYISHFNPNVQEILQNIRNLIFKYDPNVLEHFAYGLPAYKTNNKPLVYFGAFKKHIGFYATPVGHEAFKEELSGYKKGKSSVQFPLELPIPYELIEKIIIYRINENKNII